MQKILQAVGFYDGQWHVTVLQPEVYEIVEGNPVLKSDSYLETFVAGGTAEQAPEEHNGAKLEYVRKHFRDDEANKAAVTELQERLNEKEGTIAGLKARIEKFEQTPHPTADELKPKLEA